MRVADEPTWVIILCPFVYMAFYELRLRNQLAEVNQVVV